MLDRLLEQKDLDIVGISGASVGAMNAVALAQGLSDGGPEHARFLLRSYWEAVSKVTKFPLIDETDARNYMIIQVNPLVREDIPKTPYEIQNQGALR